MNYKTKFYTVSVGGGERMKRVWIDQESGTYFLCPLVEIDTSKWTDDDWNAFDLTMNDRDRSAYAEHCLECEGGFRLLADDETAGAMSPSEWCEVNA